MTRAARRSVPANHTLRLAQQVREEGVSIDEPKACLAFEEEFGFDVRPHTDVAGRQNLASHHEIRIGSWS